MHELLEEHFLALKGTPREPYPVADEATELEAQAMLAGYNARYPLEPFSVVAVEQVFEVALPGSEHTYIGKLDGVVRYTEAPYEGQLAVLEHKTEKRSSQRNSPEAWAARAQVSLYKFAVEMLYREPVSHIILDVLRRQSPAGREPAVFYRDTLERTEGQVQSALQDLIYVADQIEHLEAHYSTERWPQNTDNCAQGKFLCDFFALHVGAGGDQLVQLKYQPAKEYLGGL